MEIRNCQNQTAFGAHLKTIDYKGLSKLGVVDDVLELVPRLKNTGNDKMMLSFYATERGNIGICCEEEFRPKDGFLSGILGKTVAKGDGFVYWNEFKNIKPKLQEALQKAVSNCLNSGKGRFIAQEKQIEIERTLAKNASSDEKKNARLLSLLC